MLQCLNTLGKTSNHLFMNLTYLKRLSIHLSTYFVVSCFVKLISNPFQCKTILQAYLCFKGQAFPSLSYYLIVYPQMKNHSLLLSFNYFFWLFHLNCLFQILFTMVADNFSFLTGYSWKCSNTQDLCYQSKIRSIDSLA